MNDDTRDELLLLIAELVGSLAWANPAVVELGTLLDRARHERERPEDRG